MSNEKRGRPRSRERKDRLIQTRVARELERVLKQEADRRRLSVSHLIRNCLEDAFDLVDNVVTEVDSIVSDSVGLADQVRRDAEKIASNARRAARDAARGAPVEDDEEAPSEGEEEAPPEREDADEDADRQPTSVDDRSAHVLAWNAVILNRPVCCAHCSAELSRGDAAHLGLSADPAAPRVWLCGGCLDQLGNPPSIP